ncbi:MAG: competence/damage-inducible protein A [Deltaproteobacteria bacterium]|nr:competence/damage-inducible protein A [Deltaproteobacteria bacterium]
METLAAEIIAIGNEVLNGEIVNGNAAYLSSRLDDAGWRVVRHTVVADVEADILQAFREAESRARVAIVTGGLGPTRDDITSACAARFFGVERRLDEAVLAGIQAFFERVHYPMTENNRNQAMFPEGAVVLPNPLGTAPGFRMARADRHFFFMPGVPREMKRMMEHEVLPFLEGLLPPGSHQSTVLLRVFGIGESRLDERLSDAAAGVPGVTLGFRADFPENLIRIVAEGTSADEAQERRDGVRAEIEARLGDLVIGESDRRIEAVVGELLRERKLRLATAESCSGGLLAHRLTNVAGSSDYFERGMVVYSNEAKAAELGVAEALLEAHGAVSEPVAIAMAEGVRRAAGVDLGIAITGIAGPAGGTEEKPVGLVFIALATAEGTRAHRLQFFGDREHIKNWSAAIALNMIRMHVLGLEWAGRFR